MTRVVAVLGPVADLLVQVSRPLVQVADARGQSTRMQAEPNDVHRRLEERRIASHQQLVDGLKSHELVLSSPVSVSYKLIEHWLREVSGLELASLMHDEPFLPTRA